MKQIVSLFAAFSAALSLQAQVKVTIHESAQDQPVIPAEIYGQFSEHLGRCIYEGIWVGPDSDIPNVNGYRTDVLEALKALKVPVLRWPGGCFADEYHWMDGIGPRENRPKTVSGEILTAPDVHAYNDFGKEPAVKPAAFTGAKVSGGKVKVTLPAASVVVLEIK